MAEEVKSNVGYLGSVLFVVIVLATILIGWRLASPTHTWHYRLTVEVETPEGLKTGAAVKEVSLHHEPSILPDQGGSIRQVGYGEAVVVDLGKRGLLFVLNNRPGYFDSYEADVFFDSFRGVEKAGRSELKLEDWPALVTFRNPRDLDTIAVLSPPENVSRVDAETALDKNIEAAFGSGVHLKSIVIEVTTDPVTRGVIDKFGPTMKSADDYFERNVKKLKYGDPRIIGSQSFY